MNVLLVRHGEIPSNVKKVYAGRSPEGLNERGRGQAREVAKKLAERNVRALYTSPIRRAVETAEVIGRVIGKEPLIENAFRELELGPWEGMSESDIAREYPEQWMIWQKRPADLKLHGRETLHELLERVLRGVRNICRSKADGDVIILTHVAIMRVLMLWHKGKSLNYYKSVHVPNAEIFEIGIDEHMIKV